MCLVFVALGIVLGNMDSEIVTHKSQLLGVEVALHDKYSGVVKNRKIAPPAPGLL